MWHLINSRKLLSENSQFTCLEENNEKKIIFKVPIEKKATRIDKKEEEITKTMSYRLQFIDSARFMLH